MPKIVRPDVMIEVRTPVPPLCVRKFMMTLTSRLFYQKKDNACVFFNNNQYINRCIKTLNYNNDLKS